MGKRAPQSKDFWQGELEFVRGEAAKPTAERMGAFSAYVTMQAKFAAADGFHDIAKAMWQAVEK